MTHPMPKPPAIRIMTGGEELEIRDSKLETVRSAKRYARTHLHSSFKFGRLPYIRMPVR